MRACFFEDVCERENVPERAGTGRPRAIKKRFVTYRSHLGASVAAAAALT